MIRCPIGSTRWSTMPVSWWEVRWKWWRQRISGGRVVFISSLNGKVSFPMFGPYCGSKFALEAVADALRMELLPWDIAVVIVEPAQTDTDMWRTADTLAEETAAAMPQQMQELYQRHLAGLKK